MGWDDGGRTTRSLPVILKVQPQENLRESAVLRPRRLAGGACSPSDPSHHFSRRCQPKCAGHEARGSEAARAVELEVAFGLRRVADTAVGPREDRLFRRVDARHAEVCADAVGEAVFTAQLAADLLE